MKSKKLVALADVLQVPEEYRIAVEAALGEAATFLVAQRADDALAAVRELKDQNKGKATIVCLDRVPRVRRIAKRSSKLNWATGIIQSKQTYGGLVQFLLGDVILVESVEEAEQTVRTLAHVRCVTRDGQMVTSSGHVHGGSRRTDEGGRIGKQSQIAELEKEIVELRAVLGDIQTQLNSTVAQHDACDVSQAAAAVKSIEKEMTAIEMRIAQVEFEKKRAQDGVARNMQEQEGLGAEANGLSVDHASLAAEVQEKEKQKSDIDAKNAVAMHDLEALEVQLTDRTKVVNELEIKVVRLQSDLRNVERDIERATSTEADIQTTLARRDEEITWANADIAQLALDLDAHAAELKSLEDDLQVEEGLKAEIEQSYIAQRNELHKTELKLKDERQLHDSSVSVVHELQMKISELKSNMEHLKSRALEEFKLDLQLKSYPENEWVDFAQLREEVKGLEDRIRTLGPINFAAFDEYKTEGERLTFLTQQRDDLIDAEKTLLSTIEEINSTAQRKFMETFTKIRENFIRTFKELFQQGDECDLKLEEGVDPLEANIEITAKPRGKRPTSIDLLSGGEKTLTAIALLFAIYLVKPSPFCILDEVDAPLDDSNIDRYTRILKKFSDNTQFIVVTHNKRTMESAQALYGVTMEEEGVSKIVTVRFNDESRVQSATVTSGT